MLIKTVLAAGLAATLSVLSAPAAQAQVRAVINVGQPPPPLRAEVVPAPRRGYVWAPGYWQWQGRRHVWHGGYWVRARPGYVYGAPTWVERDGRWQFRQGGWARGDRDRDGVPNRFDRAPTNPYYR